jgi:uncharacterized protein YdeI (YjbR/CyaY-like superfamily)
MPDQLEVILFVSAAKLEVWFEQNHAVCPGAWLKIAKKRSGARSVTYAQALELALCFGWIDSQKRGFDGRYFLQRFTPRRPRGRWSRNNREKAEALIATAKMRRPGLLQVEAAMADGRWEAAYEGQRTAQVPDDLQAELEANPIAARFFANLNGANRYAFIYRLNDAKRPETRNRRLRQFVAMLAREEAFHD